MINTASFTLPLLPFEPDAIVPISDVNPEDVYLFYYDDESKVSVYATTVKNLVSESNQRQVVAELKVSDSSLKNYGFGFDAIDQAMYFYGDNTSRELYRFSFETKCWTSTSINTEFANFRAVEFQGPQRIAVIDYDDNEVQHVSISSFT